MGAEEEYLLSQGWAVREDVSTEYPDVPVCGVMEGKAIILAHVLIRSVETTVRIIASRPGYRDIGAGYRKDPSGVNIFAERDDRELCFEALNRLALRPEARR